MTRDQRKLLKLVAAVPAGEKLPLGRFARELDASQPVVTGMLQTLIEAGELDRATLRPPARRDGGDVGSASPASPSPSPAERLLSEIDAYCERTGTHPGFIGKVAFNHPGFVPLLRKRGTLREESDAAVREVLARFPDGIAKKDALAPPYRRELTRSVRPAVAVDRSGERITGKQLAAEIDAYIASVPGLNRYRFSKVYNGGSSTVAMIERSAYPKPVTVQAVRALIARGVEPLIADGAAMPISRERRVELGLPPSRKQEIDDLSRDRMNEVNERIAEAKQIAEVARSDRRPGESLADATKRQALEREERFRNATRLTTAHPLAPASADDPIDSPSSVLRRAQQDWPDQCVKVKALAEEIGVTLAEAWRRVIAAGVDCLTDPEAV